MRISYRTLLFLLLSIAGLRLQAQKTDAERQRELQDGTKTLLSLDQAYRTDSMRRAAIEAEIKDLAGTNTSRKNQLQVQLNSAEASSAASLSRLRQTAATLRDSVVGFPVVPFEDTIFYIYARSGSFSAAERSKAISERIEQIAKTRTLEDSLLTIEQSEADWNIRYNDQLILSISNIDALWQGQPADVVANSYKSRISTAIGNYRRMTSIATILREIGMALLVFLVLWLIIFLVKKAFRWLTVRIRAQHNKRIKGVKIRNYELFNAGQQIRALLWIAQILKWVTILVAIYLALPVLFGIFPWTKGFANTLFDYFWSPVSRIALGIWHYLPNLFTIIVIIIVFRYVLKGLHFLKEEIRTGDLNVPGFYPDWANPTYQIVRILVFAFMLIVIFPYLPGSESPIFRGVSVFLGLLFTFGSAGSLSNIVAGLVLTYMRAFKIGDRVKIGDVSGDIIEKSLLVTRIRTIKNEIISIPNSTVMTSHTTNYTAEAAERGLILHSTVTIGYDVPWRTVHQLLLEAAGNTKLTLKEPAPFVLQTSLDDFYISYQVNVYTNEASRQAVIYSDLHQRIQDAFNQAGVEIMSPPYRAMRDGNDSTIPSSE